MGRQLNKLTTRTLAGLKEPGRYSDGGGLYLSISPNGGRRWVFLYTRQGKTREMGLGSAADGNIGLADARRKAQAARDALASGTDPIEGKRDAARNLRADQAPTFAEFAAEYIASMKAGWKNRKHLGQWERTVNVLAAPLRSKRLAEIDTPAVLEVLKPVWQHTPTTGSRFRGRLESILDAAKAQGLREGDNPARWRGHLKSLLPSRLKADASHYKALPYDDLPECMDKLRIRTGLAARALEFLILTATRTAEVRGARWQEVEMEKRLWTIPAARMKAGKTHRIPLSDAAMAILEELQKTKAGIFVFPGNSPHKPLSVNAMLNLLRRMKIDATTHGMRSCFRDWVAEKTTFSHQTAEHALAHRISDKAESAYRRGDELEKRRQLMSAWAQYCEQRSAKVIPITRGA